MGKKRTEDGDSTLNSTATSIKTEDGEREPLPNPTTDKDEYEALMANVNVMAEPIAGRKSAKKLYKLIKKASKEKNMLRQGVVEVQRALRRGETGLVILAGDVTPIDIYAHIPGVCEDKDIPYVYTPSKVHLGLAAGHRRSTIMVLVRPSESYQSLLDECKEFVGKLPWSGMH